MPPSYSHSSLLNSVINSRFLIWIALVVGTVGVIVGTELASPYATIFPIGLVLAGVVAFILNDEQDQSGLPKWTISFSYVIIIFSLLFLAASLLYFQTGFERTISIFVLTVGLYATVVISSLTNNATRQNLGLLIVAAVFHRSTAYWSSELLLGNDVFYHNQLAAEIVGAGTMGVIQDKYFFSPVYHFLVSETSILLGVDVQSTAFLVVVLPLTTIAILLLYRLAVLWVSPQVALLAPILHAGSDVVIFFTLTPQATTLGILFGVFVLYFYIRHLEFSSRRYLGLAVVFFCLLLLTNQIASFITASSVTAIYVGSTVWPMIQG